MESVVRAPLRVRPRVFSPPRRFAQARVPRPCFVPQPDPGLSLRRAFPSQRSRTCSQAASSLEVPPPRAERDLVDLVTAGFPSPPRTRVLLPVLSGACQLSSPADYGLPFRQPKPTSRLPWVFETVIARFASSVPFEALIPLRVRSRMAGLPRPYGRCSSSCPLQRLTAFTSEPRTRRTSPPKGTTAAPKGNCDTHSRPEGLSARREGPAAPRPGATARRNDVRPTRRTPARLILRLRIGANSSPLPQGRWAVPPLGGDSFSDLSARSPFPP